MPTSRALITDEQVGPELRPEVLRLLFRHLSSDVVPELTAALDALTGEDWAEVVLLLGTRRLEDVLRFGDDARPPSDDVPSEPAIRKLLAEAQAAVDRIETAQAEGRSVAATVSTALEEFEVRNEVHRILYGDLSLLDAGSLAEVFDRLSDDDWERLAKLLRGRRLADVLSAETMLLTSPPRPRRRWAGRAHVDLLAVESQPDEPGGQPNAARDTAG